MSEALRRLPIYLLLDCSGSMTGEPIEAVRQGLRALLADLKSDPQALETAYLAVITFSSSAQQVCPLTELMAFQEPHLNASGGTALGEALQLLEQCLNTEVRKATDTQKGDWRPLVFLMTDGAPTDRWESAADRIKQMKVGNIIACAAGPNANESMLKRITEAVVKLDSLEPDALRECIRWWSDSIKRTAGKADAGAPVDLPPPPPRIQVVP